MKKIPLSTWAALKYSPTPSAWVLRRWCRDGEISPAPERVGREWYVLETATRGAAVSQPLPTDETAMPRRLSLVERLRQEEAA
jgi:hypothetical protein